MEMESWIVSINAEYEKVIMPFFFMYTNQNLQYKECNIVASTKFCTKEITRLLVDFDIAFGLVLQFKTYLNKTLVNYILR